jgi:hypothetical protein
MTDKCLPLLNLPGVLGPTGGGQGADLDPRAVALSFCGHRGLCPGCCPSGNTPELGRAQKNPTLQQLPEYLGEGTGHPRMDSQPATPMRSTSMDSTKCKCKAGCVRALYTAFILDYTSYVI